MPKRVKDPKNNLWPKFISIFLFLFSFIGFLGGAFDIVIGKQIYSLIALIMGSMAWAGLFLCLVLSFFLWTRSATLLSAEGIKATENRRERRSDHQSSVHSKKSNLKHDNGSKGITLPAGQLVSLQGFNQYFSSPEWVEMKDEDTQRAEEMEELGRDFPSYFGIGNSYYPNKPRKMTVLKGLENYIEEVDHEQKLDQAIPRQDSFTLKEVSRIPTEKPKQFSSAFKSQAEQEAFLAQFRIDEKPLDQETLDYVGDLREGSRTIDEAEKIAQVLECSISKIELDTKIISILDSKDSKELTNELTIELANEPTNELTNELTNEFTNEPMKEPVKEPVNEPPYEHTNELAIMMDTEDEPLETVGTLVEINEVEALVAVALELKPNNTVPVAPLVDERQAQLEVAKKPQVVNTVERVEPWKFPNFDLLDIAPQRVIIQDTETSQLLEKVLLDFGVKAKVIRVTSGPVITRYELAPAPGVKISKIVNLSDDIALGLAARDVRIEAPIPGKAAIGIEVPNKQARSVPFREVLETTSFREYPSKLKVA